MMVSSLLSSIKSSSSLKDVPAEQDIVSPPSPMNIQEYNVVSAIRLAIRKASTAEAKDNKEKLSIKTNANRLVLVGVKSEEDICV